LRDAKAWRQIPGHILFSNESLRFCSQFQGETKLYQRFMTPFIRISMMLKMFSLLSELKITISSTLLRNSGLNVRFSAFSMTALLFHLIRSSGGSSKPHTRTKILQLPGPDIRSHDDQRVF
jgi:hypothetical protein